MNTLQEATENWRDTPESHAEFNKVFIEQVEKYPQLSAHRTWVESNIFGFGERSFYWLWYMVVKVQAKEFVFLEIGVFRGAILSVIRIIADMQGKKVDRYGITPLNSTGGHWESDYEEDIKSMHEAFQTERDYTILKGLSTENDIIQAANVRKYDILYIDGGHEKEVAKSDLVNYSPMVKAGGYLIIDDCCNSMKIPHGMFPGIASVTEAVNEFEFTDFEFLFSIVHIRVYRKK